MYLSLSELNSLESRRNAFDIDALIENAGDKS